ncbi:TonB-dependent receptor family protein [Litoribacillus peritrichatus]|uniref:TonB-dependent receptor n=1 Tax=Litoribacillus peritrichatus TaxID=718191 RepID=A0ABP7MH79_9GAMM
MRSALTRLICTALSLSAWPLLASAEENTAPQSDAPQNDAPQNDRTVVQESMTVIGETDNNQIELTGLTETLANVPGGTNLIDLDEMNGSQASLAKVLNYEPGIVVQEFFGGNDQPRINIRGSGIQDNPVNRGIQLLYDGLSLNQPDGSFIIGLLDAEQAKYISVYRGANAMRYGATTLGGAINLHPRNASNSERSLKVEAGSFGLRKAALDLSNQWNNWDYYLNASHYQQDGFRNHSEGERDSLALNIGYQNLEWENRSYINITDNRFDIPFLLTKEEATNNPESVMGEGDTPMDELLNIPIREPFRDSQQYRLANKTSYHGLNASHTLGVYAEKTEDTFRNPLSQSDTTTHNYGLDYSTDYTHISESDLATNYLLFVSANQGAMPREYHAINPVNGSLMQQFADVDLTASNIVAGGQITQDIGLNWKALASIQWAYNDREIEDRKNPGVLDSQLTYSELNPKVGLIWSPELDQRYYANYSASSEAPNFWQLATVSASPHDPLNNYLFINDLKMQTANTIEVGTQQQWSRLSWELSYYYSLVDDELISVVGDFAVNGKTINYDGRTIHQGIEFGLNAAEESVFMAGDQIIGKLVYNYSDFRFDDGAYQGNRIAGIPTHLIQAEFGYRPTHQWYLGANVRWQPEETWVDHMNTESVQQDAFFLLGLKTSYKPSDLLNVFIELNNVTDETYQTSYAIRGQGAPDLPTFIPGAGFNFSTGMKVSW